MKKLGIILLVIVLLLSTLSLLPVRKVSASEEERRMLMAAEPWHWEYHSSKGGSGGSSGSSGGDNQGISDPTNHSVTKHPLGSSTQIPSYQRERQDTIKKRDSFLNWKLKLLFFWQMIFNK